MEFTHSETLEVHIVDERYLVPARGTVQHTKTGGVYEIEGHYDKDEPLVLYRSKEGKLWGRPFQMFYGKDIINGIVDFRFKQIETKGSAMYAKNWS